MSMLSPTGLIATITYLGINQSGEDLTTDEQPSVNVDYAGFRGDNHSGLTRSSCVRVQKQYPKGTEIRNTRQISALSSEELGEIAADMGIDKVQPAWVGANLVMSGIPAFSKIPPSSRLIAANKTSLVVDMENAPCRFPGEIIEKFHPEKGGRFARHALNRRGVTLWVEHTGSLSLGDKLELHIPPPCTWRQP
jgi:MOSC domain-containing protein YiiM